jgi:general secretion pathway protein G
MKRLGVGEMKEDPRQEGLRRPFPRKPTGSRARGFTLIELLIVVAVIGIVAALSVVALANALDKAKQRATMADMRSIGRAIEAYHVDHGMLPNGNIAALPPVLTPYQINVVPTNDHWGHEYDYSSNGVTYSLQSGGKDGVDGADITLATRFDFNRDIVISDGQFIAAPE